MLSMHTHTHTHRDKRPADGDKRGDPSFRSATSNSINAPARSRITIPELISIHFTAKHKKPSTAVRVRVCVHRKVVM